MRVVSFYDKTTGVFHGSQLTTTDEAAIALNTPAGHVAIDGQHDASRSRVDIASGQVVDYQPAAPEPAADHVWNATTKRWRLTDALASKAKARSEALAGIAKLEASQHRAVREATLGMAGAQARLQAIDAAIAKLRAGL